MHRGLRRAARITAAALVVLVSVALAWFAVTPQLEIAGARNILLYRAEALWRAHVPPRPATAPGTLAGRVTDERGDPLSDATVVASDSNGRVFSAWSDSAGYYTLTLPAGGATVPLATRAGYDDAPLQFVWFRRSVAIAPGAVERGDFSLRRAAPRNLASDDSLRFLDDVTAHTHVPAPADVRRRAFTFTNAGTALAGSHVYEPLVSGRYPILLIIYPCWAYPCSTLNWDLLSATMAAEGFVVVTFSPQRGTDLEADMADILKLLAHVRQGELSAWGDPQKVALLAGSLTSIHIWRVAQLAPDGAVRAVVSLGGISDLFLIRQRFEAGELGLEPQFAEPLFAGLIGLGRPNLNPELYVRYSPVYHLDALARVRIALIHGGRDKTVPYEQTVHFSQLLANRGIAHETYLYPTREHYLDLANINADELDMLEKVVGFLRGALR